LALACSNPLTKLASPSSWTEQQLSFERQLGLPLIYRGQKLDCGYRIDLLVEDSVIVEVKAVERIERVHRMHVLSYLRQSDCRVGLLINFNVRGLVDAITRIVNGFPETWLSAFLRSLR